MSRLFGSTPRCTALFRSALGVLVALDAADRWPLLEWLYSDEGALPRWAAMPAFAGEGVFVWAACLHAWHGSLAWARLLSCVQVLAAAALAHGSHPRSAAFVCWLLHVSICLRNASLIYILDRYMHLLLLYSIFLPAPPTSGRGRGAPSTASRCTVASVGLWLQLLLIYTDAGLGKAADPARTWSLNAPVAALDTYLRHTPVALAVRSLLGGGGLRVLGAFTVAVELLCVPLALLAPSVSSRRLAICAACGMHVSIGLTMRNTGLLSTAAIVAWLPFLDGPAAEPTPAAGAGTSRSRVTRARSARERSEGTPPSLLRAAREPSSLLLLLFGVCTSLHQWGGGGGPGCGGRTGSDALRTMLLHNRWNVFTSAESYVVWEVAPARLSDGSIVDIWRDGEQEIAWEVPLGREPSRRRGRWRAFPYTAERDAEAEEAFWRVLCNEWEAHDPQRRRVLGYHFYMLQADALPMPTADEAPAAAPPYGEVTKRLIKTFSCAPPQTAAAASAESQLPGTRSPLTSEL